MTDEKFFCPACGAPLPVSDPGQAVTCEACGRVSTPTEWVREAEIREEGYIDLTPDEPTGTAEGLTSSAVTPPPFESGWSSGEAGSAESGEPGSAKVFSTPETPSGGPTVIEGGVPPRKNQSMNPWIIAGIVILVILCISCLCLLAAMGVFGAVLSEFSGTGTWNYMVP